MGCRHRPVAFLTVIERLQRVFREGGEAGRVAFRLLGIGEALDVLKVQKMPKPKDI